MSMIRRDVMDNHTGIIDIKFFTFIIKYYLISLV